MIHYKCPKCDSTLNFSNSLAGQAEKCPACGESVRIPNPPLSEPTSEKENITKIDAAKRQMNEAIRLFFERRDSISIHTLAAAAAQILADLCKAKGVFSPLRGADLIRKERRKEWLRALKASENFFKHARRDPDAMHEFNMGLTEGILFDAAQMYGALTGRHTYAAGVFQLWLFVKDPEILLECEQTKTLLKQLSRLNVAPDNWQFFRDMLTMKRHLPPGFLEMLKFE